MPTLVACGGRNQVFDDFKTAIASGRQSFVAMLIDSEDPVNDAEATWQHLRTRDGWDQPSGATDDQVLFMTTCMETWIMADHQAIRSVFGNGVQDSALLPLEALETRNPKDVRRALESATKSCAGPYVKGKRSFEVLGRLDPAVLREHLPSFVRVHRILSERSSAS